MWWLARIPDAHKIRTAWIIPKDTPRPKDKTTKKTGSVGGHCNAQAKDNKL